MSDIVPFFHSADGAFTLLQGDCIELLERMDAKFDMIFADPPYFLSNGGISLQSGKVVCVDKGEWDKGGTPEKIRSFNEEWLALCRNRLKDNGTIWISGTYHNIFSVANALTGLGFKILNVITWAKTNPPPNISCRYFTYSTEFIVWARKEAKLPHYYNYELMKRMNAGRQMTDVWHLPAVGRWEKSCGNHPTQKPLALLARILLAATRRGDTVLDPFAGSCTTGIAANLLERRFVGIDQCREYLEYGARRKQEIADAAIADRMRKKITEIPAEAMVMVNHARKDLKERMIEKGLCYLRAGDSQGSLLVTPGFERLQYLLLHTNGEDCQLFKLKKPGCFQIWTRETLQKYGFEPQHGSHYIVLHFDAAEPVGYVVHAHLKERSNTYRAKIRPLSELVGLQWD